MSSSEDWKRALCRQHNPELWSLGKGNRGESYQLAHAICRVCPFSTPPGADEPGPCERIAIDTGSWGMIFGGRDFPRPKRIPAGSGICSGCGNIFKRRSHRERWCTAICRNTFCRQRDRDQAQQRRALRRIA